MMSLEYTTPYIPQSPNTRTRVSYLDPERRFYDTFKIEECVFVCSSDHVYSFFLEQISTHTFGKIIHDETDS